MYTYFLMCIILFFPSKYFSFYHVVVLMTVIVFLILSKKKNMFNNSTILKILASLIFLISINSILASMYFFNNTYRNMSEIIRFIPSLLLIMSFKSNPINSRYVVNSLFLYIIIVFIVCYLQFNSVSIIDTITKVYADPRQIEGSLELSRRALGLSTGPGSNATILVIIYSYFLALFFSMEDKKNELLLIISLSVSSFSVLLTQSQTGFIVLCLITIYAITFNLIFPFNKKSRKKSLFLSIFILVAFIPIIARYWDELRYLLSLFDSGLERNSYQKREEKVLSTMELITSGPITLFLIGYGKDYIPNSTALDNEYVFLLSVYGVFIFLCIIVCYLTVILRSWLIRVKDANYLALHFIIVAGMILSWPSSFLLEPRTCALLAVLVSIYLKNRKISL